MKILEKHRSYHPTEQKQLSNTAPGEHLGRNTTNTTDTNDHHRNVPNVLEVTKRSCQKLLDVSSAAPCLIVLNNALHRKRTNSRVTSPSKSGEHIPCV